MISHLLQDVQGLLQELKKLLMQPATPIGWGVLLLAFAVAAAADLPLLGGFSLLLIAEELGKLVGHQVGREDERGRIRGHADETARIGGTLYYARPYAEQLIDLRVMIRKAEDRSTLTNLEDHADES